MASWPAPVPQVLLTEVVAGGLVGAGLPGTGGEGASEIILLHYSHLFSSATAAISQRICMYMAPSKFLKPARLDPRRFVRAKPF
jgi:hypothetical protein